MDRDLAARYLVALTRQIAELTAALADPRDRAADRRAAAAARRADLRRARRKRRLLLADPLFPRGGERRDDAAYPADAGAGRPAALPLRGR